MGQDVQDLERDEIDLTVLWSMVRARWKLVIACAAIALLASVATHYDVPTVYRVEMRVAAADPDALGSDMLARRNVRETSTRAPNTAGFQLYLESLRTREAADAVLRDPAMLKDLFPGQWNDAQQRWRIPPDEAAVRRLFADEIFVDQNIEKHAFATIRMRSTRPDGAMRLLGLLQQTADSLVRNRMLAQAKQRLAALDALRPPAGESGAVREARGVQQVILARALAAAPFAAQLVDAPFARPDPSFSPIRAFASATVIGLAIGMLLACLLEWIAGRRAGRPTLAPADAGSEGPALT